MHQFALYQGNIFIHFYSCLLILLDRQEWWNFFYLLTKMLYIHVFKLTFSPSKFTFISDVCIKHVYLWFFEVWVPPLIDHLIMTIGYYMKSLGINFVFKFPFSGTLLIMWIFKNNHWVLVESNILEFFSIL